MNERKDEATAKPRPTEKATRQNREAQDGRMKDGRTTDGRAKKEGGPRVKARGTRAEDGRMKDGRMKERARLEVAVAQGAGLVKMVCGVANNAARNVMLEGHDHARRCKRYGHQVKRAFVMAEKEWHDYERRLVYATENRMFHVADMTPEIRRKYGDITDRQYYDFWASMGGVAYDKTRPVLTSLWNKHRLSMEGHGVQDAEHVAWVLNASAALELAIHLYEGVVRQCCVDLNIPKSIALRIFSQFDLSRVVTAWNKTMMLLAPDSSYPLDALEKRNVELGVEQLCEAWVDPSLMYDSSRESVQEYVEVFASKGFQKKVLREIADVQAETEKELKRK